MPADESSLPPSAVEELGFWRDELALRGKHADSVRRRLDPAQRAVEFPDFLRDPVIPLLRGVFSTTEPLTCLELGSGPLSSLAWGVDAKLLDVTAVDVLADHYRALLDEHGHGAFPVRPVAGTGETLLERFDPESFQLVYVRNALDHTDDLPRSFDNLVRLTTEGGAIVLQHHLNEGSHREWSASHHWNLDLGARGLSATHRSGTTHEVGARKDLELVYLSYRSYLLDGWIDVIYRKV
ncbi:MAG: class I SAM-dependent methyltransferase [Planctomycetes bacterium]|nr:class I SAM-dependent methyltransferase [Planctomycetota bacterium]